MARAKKVPAAKASARKRNAKPAAKKKPTARALAPPRSPKAVDDAARVSADASLARKLSAVSKNAAAAPPAGAKMRVPLASVFVAKENPRHGQPIDDLEGIQASIRKHGQLQDLICYAQGQRFAATDGARRLAGLDASGGETVAIVVYDKADAIARGAAAQVERVNLHAADEAVLFARLIKAGEEPAQIAKDFGRTERFVLQRQRLAGLHPPILAALRKDDIDIEQASAWANAPADRQPALWKRLGRNASRWHIAGQLDDERIEPTERLAKFVGEEAYLAAGGEVDQRLFQFDDQDADRTWDRKLVDKLAGEKVDAAKEKYAAEGWGWVAFGENGKPWDLKKHPKAAKTEADRQGRGVWLSLGKQGQINAEKNLVSAKSAEAAAKKAAKAKAGKGKVEDDEADDAALMTNAAHERLTRAAGLAIGRAMLGKPIGVVVIITHLARRVLGPSTAYHPPGAVRLRLDSARSGVGVTMKPNAAWDASLARWRKFTIEHWATLEAAADGLSGEEFEEFSSVVAARLVDSVEFNANRGWGGQRRLLAQIGALAGCAPSDHWAPDVDFLKGLSKGALAAACAEVGIKPLATKGKTAEALAIAAADKGWTPLLFRQLVGAEPAPPVEEDEDDPLELDAEDLEDDVMGEDERPTGGKPPAAMEDDADEGEGE